MPPPEPTPTVPAAVPSAAPPQYGEYAPPPQAAQPQYGQYAAQPQYSQPASSGQYPGQYYAAPPMLPKTLGVVAFVAGLVVLIVSPIVSIFIGVAIGPHEVSGGFSANFNATSQDRSLAVVGIGVVAQLLFGTLIGVWALVQGIIAVRARRGRVFGILAIVFAGVAPILSFIVYLIASVVARGAA